MGLRRDPDGRRIFSLKSSRAASAPESPEVMARLGLPGE